LITVPWSLKWPLSMVELVKAARIESAVTGPAGLATGAPATGDPHAAVASTAAAPAIASIRR
jgi:hypothetical protein